MGQAWDGTVGARWYVLPVEPNFVAFLLSSPNIDASSESSHSMHYIFASSPAFPSPSSPGRRPSVTVISRDEVAWGTARWSQRRSAAAGQWERRRRRELGRGDFVAPSCPDPGLLVLHRRLVARRPTGRRLERATGRTEEIIFGHTLEDPGQRQAGRTQEQQRERLRWLGSKVGNGGFGQIRPDLAEKSTGDVLGGVERLVDVHGVVDHVGATEEADLGFEDLLVRVELPLLEELQQREHQVAIQLRRHERRQVVLRHGCSPPQEGGDAWGQIQRESERKRGGGSGGRSGWGGARSPGRRIWARRHKLRG